MRRMQIKTRLGANSAASSEPAVTTDECLSFGKSHSIFSVLLKELTNISTTSDAVEDSIEIDHIFEKAPLEVDMSLKITPVSGLIL